MKAYVLNSDNPSYSWLNEIWIDEPQLIEFISVLDKENQAHPGTGDWYEGNIRRYDFYYNICWEGELKPN